MIQSFWSILLSVVLLRVWEEHWELEKVLWCHQVTLCGVAPLTRTPVAVRSGGHRGRSEGHEMCVCASESSSSCCVSILVMNGTGSLKATGKLLLKIVWIACVLSDPSQCILMFILVLSFDSVCGAALGSVSTSCQHKTNGWMNCYQSLNTADEYYNKWIHFQSKQLKQFTTSGNAQKLRLSSAWILQILKETQWITP